MRVFFAIVPLALAASPLAGCVEIPGLFGPQADAGTADDAGATATDAGAGPTGTGCTQDLGGGIVLCTTTSLCANLTVDHDKLPDCGFRMNGSAIDIECVCNGDSLCSMGVPASCQQASDMLDQQTETQVCQQVSDGRCIPLSGSSGGSSSGGSTSAGTCDKACASECAGNPSCLQLCGC